ncbi:class I SAM-dependent methyltransferase [candidate division KSB1 bacterium]
MQNDDKVKDFFLSGFYEEFWGWRFPEKDDRKTAESILELLEIRSGHVLDWCGGWGRVSQYFAEKGFRVSILDINKSALERASELFKGKGLDVDLINTDCRETPEDINADDAVCLFNSVGFFSDEEQIKAFTSLNNALENGGRLVVDCMNLLFIQKHFKPVMTEENDGRRYVRTNDLDNENNVMDSTFEMYDETGEKIKSGDFRQRLYSPDDLRTLIESAGFSVLDIYGNYDKKPFSSSNSKIVLVAQK